MSVTWEPFFLQPDIPKEGVPKDGTPATRVSPALQDVNKKEGPAIQFTGKCDRYPNTEDYHVAMAYVLEKHGADAQNRCASRTFKAYFQDGIFPDEKNLISQIGEVVADLDTAALLADLRSKSKVSRVKTHARDTMIEYQITGVPYFIINGHFEFSGAQDPEYFVSAFEQA